MPVPTLEDCIVNALKNVPDDGSILLSAFHGAGGPFGDDTVAGLEVLGFGSLPDTISFESFQRMREVNAVPSSSTEDALVPAARLKFTNPNWENKVDGVLSELNVQDVFNVELEGLLLSCAGSQGAFPVKGMPGVAGSLVITLPSYFEGGQVRTRRGEGEERFSLDSGSQSSHGYVAFLKEQFIEVEPITMGCRVALIYNIVYKQLPEPEDPTEDIATLRQTLYQWRIRPQTTPNQLVCYLEEPFGSIDGQEEVPAIVRSQMSFLTQAGGPEGFEFRVACLTYTVLGRVEEPVGERVDPSVVELDEIVKETVELDDFRGLDGRSKPVGGQITRPMKTEELLGRCPGDLFDGENEKPEEAYNVESDDSGDVEMTDGNFYRVEKVFRCNVLVLIPPGR